MRKKIYSHKNRMVLLFCLLAFAGISKSNAQCSIDNYGAEVGNSAIGPDVYVGQSFYTPCNELLNNILVFHSNYQNSGHYIGTVNVYAGGGTTGTLLTTQSYDAVAGQFDEVIVVFPTPLSLKAGNTYTFMITSTTIHYLSRNNNQYSGGIFYSKNNGGTSSSSATDLKFALGLTSCTPTTSSTDSTICSSELPFSWNGLTFNVAGTQTATLTNAAGCDSSATLNLSVKNATSSSTDSIICSTALPFLWNELTFTDAGSQTKTGLINAAGCDSSATLNLSVKNATSSSTDSIICSTAIPFYWNGLWFYDNGSQTITGLINAADCDSSATLNLSVKNASFSSTDTSICASALPFSWNGLTFTDEGSQTKTGFTNAAGCDSSATFNLTVYSASPPSLSATPSTICLGQSSVLSAIDFVSGFKGYFDPSNWILTQTSPGSGYLDASIAPYNITLVKYAQIGTIEYVYKKMPASGQLTFRWNKRTSGIYAPFYVYYFNNGIWNLISNSVALNSGGESITINVTKGEDFGFRIRKPNNGGLTTGYCAFEILAAPVPSAVSWFTTSTGGSAFSTDASTTVTPTVGGTVNYYAQTTDAVSGCVSSTRDVIAVEVKTPVGITSLSAGNNPICGGTKTTLTANDVTGTNAVVTWYDAPGGTGNVVGSGLTSDSVAVGTFYAYVTGECGGPIEISITVLENTTQPIITCRGDSTVPTLTTSCIRAVGFANNTSSANNCNVTALTWALTGATVAKSSTVGINQLPVRTYNKGVTTVTLTVKNAAGNTTSCSYNVTVVDNVLPVFTYRNTATINANVVSGCSANVQVPDATFTDNCGTPFIGFEFTGATTGSYKGQIGTKAFNKGTTVVTYYLRDQAANLRTSSFNVVVKDTIKPSFTTAPANINVSTASCTASINVPDVSFTDNCGTPSLKWVATGSTTGNGNGQVGTMNFNLGTTTLTYTLTDANANVRTASITVKVTETTPPVMTCPANITTSTVGTSCTKNIATLDPVYASSCGVKSLTWNMTGATVLSSPISGTWLAKTKTFKAGLTTVKYTATYLSGSTSTCTYTVQLNTTNTCPIANQSRSIVANEETTSELKAVLSPNPTSSTFALRVKSNSNAAVEVTVYNSEGKRVQQLKTANLNNIIIGEKYQTGSYMFDVRQGEKRTTVVGVKQ